MRAPAALVALALLLSAPLAAAEFGPESADGFPINVEGKVLRPPYAPIVEFVPGEPLNKLGPFTAYPYYPALTAEVQRLARDHPDLVKVTSAGKSTLGLDLWFLEIADFANPDMKPLEAREVLYVDGGTHSNEYSGVYFVTELAQFLLDEYESNETAKWIVENRHTYLLPMVNPDGSNAFGRLNAKTVNVNRNFPATWGAVEEDPVMNNPGPEPASEPETRVVIGILDQLRPDYANSIHCCGNLWLHPWGAEHLPPAPDLQMFTRICDEAFAEVREDCGPIWSTIYPASGTTADEGYNRTGASSWSYEMSGRGAYAPWGQPVITGSVREQERESWNGILHAFLNVEKYGAHPRVLAVEGDATTLRVTVENDGYGNLTAGNLTVGGVTVPLPFLAPNASAVVEVEGAFAAGAAPIALDYVKRAHLAPGGRAVEDVLLVAEGRRLVGVLGSDADLVDPLSADPSAVPAPGLALLVVALAAALALARKRA